MLADLLAHRRLALITQALLGLAVASAAMAQEGRRSDEKSGKSKESERIEGVIVKVEPVADQDTKDAPRHLRLTINTAAVWIDYSRDTSTTKPKSSKEAARKGDDSIATKGQPRDEDTLVRLVVAPDTPLKFRHRCEGDSGSLGAATVEEARKLAASEGRPEKSVADDKPDLSDSRSLKPGDLKVGQFVAVHFHHANDRQQADWLVVLDPVREKK